ncbi:hypothetical protein SAMN05444921_12095 [Streptomyces wuyuanensis]|uniref:Uncharacterized protein n=1 Tax=Streptomyces wuyuanensis TaxID=1196353 RepID=A0A1G9Z1H5_9ACTN|nr:hypothetical protein SAMN05444921_12095 [Streptomyces wuyuanensis]
MAPVAILLTFTEQMCWRRPSRPAFPEAAGTAVTWGYSCHLSAHTHWEK